MTNTPPDNQAQLHLSATLGALMQILMNTPRQHFKLVSIVVQTLPAVRLNQVCVHRNVRGEPVAYAMWAFLSDEVAAEMRNNPDRLLHYSEWNEGLNLWIVDFVALPGYALPLATQMRTGCLRDFERAQGLRTRADGSVRKLASAPIYHPRRRPQASPSNIRSMA